MPFDCIWVPIQEKLKQTFNPGIRLAILPNQRVQCNLQFLAGIEDKDEQTSHQG